MRLSIASLLIAPALAAPACDASGGASPPAFDDPQVLVAYADAVVIPTYDRLAAQAVALDQAIAALAATPDEAHLALAQSAWVAARVPWEQSEAFLFGPVETFGIDPSIDTWPLNQTDLDAVLASGDALSQGYVANLPPTQKGFHTLEYLLFGQDKGRTAASLTARELEYLQAIAAEFEDETARLADAWETGEAGAPPFRTTFTTAGQAGNSAYPSLAAAGQEVVNGMIGICDEVANGKIADPFDARDPLLEESQFSHNSLQDFQDNIRSVRNGYLGGLDLTAPAATSLSAWVAARDAALDADLRAQIEQAIAGIGAIPAPFSAAIVSAGDSASIESAQAHIRTLQATLETRLLPHFQ
ncbi:MAG: imelysin family protein [Myxococcota bacterium]